MKNIFWMSFLICSISVQLVNCLVCRNCVSPASCRYTKVVQCTNYAANVTSQYLATYHQNVLELNSSRFNCLALKYVYTKTEARGQRLEQDEVYRLLWQQLQQKFIWQNWWSPLYDCGHSLHSHIM
ncbi:uncharacterized protein Dmoj_GI17458, isoform B [Drosophila mojavensis]|uniref:Uncharacterized protein, isoform B n=1 Tax=Drosophila mojavensis TaxID=7230 RepID=A0A0Q9XFU8_DROMO|nr:uncharacterized protein Dmoj_GI17458, isoform B [Drosophila mojavensis]